MIECLRGKIPNDEYEKYLSKVTYSAKHSEGDIKTFIAPNVFIANWIKAKYTKMLEEELEKATNKKSKIAILTKIELTNKPIYSKKIIARSNTNFTYTSMKFENFVVGENNEMAFQSAKETIKAKGKWNPLFIYGDTGLGKTHLLNAIANEIFKNNPNADVISITTETMLNEYVHRIKEQKTLEAFRNRMRNCDYLLLDDIQFIENKEKFQEELFNTFNDIINKNGQIVMTCDKPPKLIKKIPDRMRSRFEGGLMVKINHPELETKIKIIELRCKQNEISLDKEQIKIIALEYNGNTRAIDGLIITLRANAAIMGISITTEMIRQAIKDREIENDVIGFEDIIRAIAIEYNIKPTEIRTKVKGKKQIARARKIAAFIAKQETNMTMPQIASELNLKDHSAVSKQIKNITEEFKENKELEDHIKELILKIKNK